MTLTSGSIEGKQICAEAILSVVMKIPFVYREKRKMKREVFFDSSTEATASATKNKANQIQEASSQKAKGILRLW